MEIKTKLFCATYKLFCVSEIFYQKFSKVITLLLSQLFIVEFINGHWHFVFLNLSLVLSPLEHSRLEDINEENVSFIT